MRIIDVDALSEYKFLTPQVKVIGGRHNGKTLEAVNRAYQQGWNDAIDAIVDNAPTVEEKSYAMGYQDGAEDGLQGIRPQGKWIITGEEQGALGITYKIRKCNKCGWEHSLVIPNNFCPNCGADMRKEENND